MRTRVIKYLPALLALLITVSSLYGQTDLNKEIVVVRQYEPSLSDAHKINVLPRLTDSVRISPSFDYAITPVKYETGFQLKEIAAANLLGASLDKLYKGYMKLGMGTALNPLAEININSLRSRDKSWGVYMNHESINGKIKLDDGNKVKPGYFDNTISLYGKKLFRKLYAMERIEMNYNGGNFYGATDTTLEKDMIKQNYLMLSGEFSLGTMHRDSSHLNYQVKAAYTFTQDHYKYLEHGVSIGTNMNMRLRSGSIAGGLAGIDYFNSAGTLDSVNNTIFRIEPWLGKTTGEYSYRIGIKLAGDIRGNDFQLYMYPDLNLQINVVKGILIPYLGADGRLQNNAYRQIAMENRYIVPGLSIKSTNHKIRGYAGLKGNFSKKLSYDASISYSLFDDMYFYINDSSDILGNRFDAVYDGGQLTTYRAMLNYIYSDKLSFLLDGNLYQYRMEKELKPWHKPLADIAMTSMYNLKDKILVDVQFFYMGKRYALSSGAAPAALELKGFLDANLGVEYRYTKILSAFLRVNNILGSRNYIWNQYPAIGFNVMAGFTYAL